MRPVARAIHANASSWSILPIVILAVGVGPAVNVTSTPPGPVADDASAAPDARNRPVSP